MWGIVWNAQKWNKNYGVPSKKYLKFDKNWSFNEIHFALIPTSRGCKLGMHLILHFYYNNNMHSQSFDNTYSASRQESKFFYFELKCL